MSDVWLVESTLEWNLLGIAGNCRGYFDNERTMEHQMV
jgi:hypothetical protein